LASFIGVVVFVVVAGLAREYLGFTKVDEGPYRAKDGDSISYKGRDIRLYGIDAPELRQHCDDKEGASYDCGTKAREALRSLIRGRTVSCRSRERDRYGRDVAVCSVAGVELNREMVKRGWAIAYRRISTRYVAEEDEARKAKRGIWQGRFQQPEAYRNDGRDTTEADD
jgi:endonuclease YncB( thermonuclease family)